MLCSVVKNAGSGRARKKCLVLYRFLRALQQNRAQSRLLYLFYDKESDHIPMHLAEFSNQTLFYKREKVASAVY